ncbi:hypothetical protein HK101_011326 [Irineochytrium annulatum]|nr:hypothetical protein HK101_011326 [Irineochytrium annulatum]
MKPGDSDQVSPSSPLPEAHKMSTTTAPPAAVPLFFVRVSVPSLGVQKALKASPTDLVWHIKKQVCEKMTTDLKDALNHGLFMAPVGGKLGKFLEEKRDLASYQMETNCLLEFIPKKRQNVAAAVDAEAAPTAKNQKKFVEDVRNGNVEKIKDRGVKGMDPNFWTEAGETPLSIAVMNNDKEAISALVENGAFLDYRVSEALQWKTPLHIAASQNKAVALQALLSFGAWVNTPDIMGLTPVYYAASLGLTECVEKLLFARAETEIFDESGKGPLHQACMNNHDGVVGLLIDCGANMAATNVAGNTPLHIAAARNATECLKWLLLRGADRERGNKSGQSAFQVASLSGSTEAVEILKAFVPDSIVPPPPKLEDLLDQIKRANIPAMPSSPSSTNLRLHQSTVVNPNANPSTPPASLNVGHLRSASEHLRSSMDVLPAALLPSSAASGHGRSMSEYTTTTHPSRRLSSQMMAAAGASRNGAGVSRAPAIVGSTMSLGAEEQAEDASSSSAMPTSGSMYSIAAEGVNGGMGSQSLSVGTKRISRRAGPASARVIPAPPSGPRPSSVPPPPARTRPSSLEAGTTKRPSPLSTGVLNGGSSIELDRAKSLSAVTITKAADKDSTGAPDSPTPSLLMTPPPSAGAGGRLNGAGLVGNSAGSLNTSMDALAVIHHLKTSLESGTEVGELEADFEALERTLLLATTRASKLEVECQRLRRELDAARV